MLTLSQELLMQDPEVTGPLEIGGLKILYSGNRRIGTSILGLFAFGQDKLARVNHRLTLANFHSPPKSNLTRRLG